MAALEDSVAALARIGSCRSPSFSPDGARVALVSNLGGLPQVWTVPAAGGWPGQVTALDDPVGEVRWSPDGAWLAFSLAPGGGMNQQVYLVRPDGRDLRRLSAGGRDNNWLGPWAHDGSALAVSSNREGAGAMDAYLVDVASGQWRRLAAGRNVVRVADLSPDGRWAAVDRQVSRGDNDLVLVPTGGGEEVLLTPHTPPATSQGARFLPGSGDVLCASNVGRDRMALVAAAADGSGLRTLIEQPDAELETFALSQDGRWGALVWNAAGRSDLSLVDFAANPTPAAVATPGAVITEARFAPGGWPLAIVTAGAAAPADLWMLDGPDAAWRQVTYSAHPGVDLAALVRPELARFAAHDGLELTGWLYRAGGRGPMVLSFHGGPEGQERPTLNPTYQALLALGISVFAPNVRGSGGFGKRFVNLDNGALRVDAIRDIGACLDFVVGEGIADPARVGIMGGSYGGYMTMAGLTEYPDRFAAGANLYGVVNFETFFRHTEPWMAAISRVEYGDPDTEVDMLRRLSPVHRLDRVRAPVLVLHGANDTNVPVVEAEQVVAGLRERGVAVEYILFPDEGHGFTRTANRIRAAGAVAGWFQRHLG